VGHPQVQGASGGKKQKEEKETQDAKIERCGGRKMQYSLSATHATVKAVASRRTPK